MRIEQVNIEDVFPVEDEYGNQYLSRDYSRAENIRYIDELAASFANGEPNEPPVLVADGGIYRIKAGNSRIMAMRQLGTKTFTAIIDENDTPQALVEAAIRTNTKKKYEDVEESRFVQQLCLICPDDYVSEVVNIPAADVAKVRRVRKTVDEAADDLTIERMIALAELDEDSEHYDAVLNASADTWQRVYQSAIRTIRAEKVHDELAALLESKGVEIDGDTLGLSFYHGVGKAEDLKDEYPSGSVAVWNPYAMHMYVYNKVYSTVVDPEVEAAKERKAQNDILFETTKDHREKWLASHLDVSKLKPLLEIQEEACPYEYNVVAFLEEHELTLPDSPADAIAVFLEHKCKPYGAGGVFYTCNCNSFCNLTDALKACGYEPCFEEEQLYTQASAFLAESEGEDE